MPTSNSAAARAFTRSAAQAGLVRIVYLGGLGNDEGDLATHLRGRREVEDLLGSTGVPVTTLRTEIIIGPRRDLLGDYPPARRASPRHDHATLGADTHPADRYRRRDGLPGRRS
jgi:uncharacterized protein YbjT (DUF2867 family)